MTSEKWQEIKFIFNQVLEIPALERDDFLLKVCPDDEEMRREIEKMLVFAEDENDKLEENAFQFLNDEKDDVLPERIGNYKIIREIGRGGMGVVYEALRETSDFKQKVAIKVIKRGMDTDIILSRFRHERQILASLQHPNIARFLDGGMTADNLPFYSMEFVEGKEIDEYCRENNLSIEDRLKLFRQVCSAVQYAHQNFIAHRDLKPNNILVNSDGTPKLLDFGIAKVLSDNLTDKTGTATKFGMMTPAYASPEQVRGEKVGVHSDIYSLGVILYELLTEQKPYKINFNRADEAIKAICESEPVRPSSAVSGRGKVENGKWKAERDKTNDNHKNTTNPKSKIQNPKSLRGDLDNIILKALKKEPERRYASVEQFSEDIRRHLEGLPVTARPDTFIYRTSKFIKRNKVSVIAALLIFLALVAGILGTGYQTYVAQTERTRAEKRFKQVRKLANNVVFKYHDAIANLPGSTATREMLVKDATEYLDNLAQDSDDNTDLQNELAQAYLKIGKVQGAIYLANLGDSEGALQSYDKSSSIFEGLIKKNPRQTEYLKNYFEAVNQKTLLLGRLYRWQEAQISAQKLSEVTTKLIELEPENVEFRNLVNRGYITIGDVADFTGGHQECIKWYRKGLQAAEEIYQKNTADESARRNVVVSLQRLGTRLEYYVEILKEKNEPKEKTDALYIEAEQIHHRSYEMAENLRRDFPENAMYIRYIGGLGINWGTALARIGKGKDGIPYILNSCKNFREIAAGDTQNNEAKRDIAECLQYLAFANEAANESNKAVEANQESLKILEEITIKDPTNFEFLNQAHLTYNNTGDIFLKQGKTDEALSFYEKGMAYVEKMSKFNNSPQIAILRSESNRKIGEAHLAIAEKSRDVERLKSAKSFLINAQTDLIDLQQKNQLGKNYEHKLEIIQKDIMKIDS